MVWSPLLKSLASGSVRESCLLSLASSPSRLARARERLAISSFTLVPRSPSCPPPSSRLRSIGCSASVASLSSSDLPLDLPVQVCDLFGEPPARENARLAGVAMEEGAVERNEGSAHETEFTCQQHETAVHRLQGLPVLLA